MHTPTQDGEVQYYLYLTEQAACEECSLARWARGSEAPQQSLHPWQYKLDVVLPDGERVEPRRGPETSHEETEHSLDFVGRRVGPHRPAGVLFLGDVCAASSFLRRLKDQRFRRNAWYVLETERGPAHEHQS